MGLTFGGEYKNQHALRSMKCADNYWLFFDNRDGLVCMVNDIIEELMVLDMEPKLESLWWTSTYQAEEKETLKVANRGLAWDLPFQDVFEFTGYSGWERVSGCRSNVVQRHGQLVERWLHLPIKTSVGVPHLHLHHHQTRVRTSLQPPRSTTERG